MLVALLSCPRDRLKRRCTALEMCSQDKVFRASYDYAKIASDRVFLLSAKYGLLESDDVISHEIENMAIKPPYEKRLWAANVIDKLEGYCDLNEDEFMFLGEQVYFENLIDKLKTKFFPLEGIPEFNMIAKLQELKDTEVAYVSAENIHRMFHEIREYTWKTLGDIPYSNGLYVVFERTEEYKGFKRITKVGTHRGDGNLKNRLETDFIREDKNWSMLRKNIGRAILNKNNDPYLKIWDMDTGTTETRLRYADQMDEVKERDIEKRITMFLRDQVTFAVLEVESWYERMRIEEAIVATLNRDPEFIPSDNWFGRFSPEYAIRNSGLWMKRGLDRLPIKRTEMETIEMSVNKQKLSMKDDEELTLAESVTRLIDQKKETAESIRLRYIDLYSEDIRKEVDAGHLEDEVIEAMKTTMGKHDEILLKTESGAGTSIKIRFHL